MKTFLNFGELGESEEIEVDGEIFPLLPGETIEVFRNKLEKFQVNSIDKRIEREWKEFDDGGLVEVYTPVLIIHLGAIDGQSS